MRDARGSAAGTRARASGVRALVADDDPAVRSLFGALLRQIEDVSAVVEVEDGARAVEVARVRRVHIAVLDLNMPRLDGAQAARLLLALQPSMGIALHSSDPELLRVRAAGLGLPTFDKLEFDALAAWVEREARAQLGRRSPLPARLELCCARCGYGIVSGAPPAFCPMCHGVAAWSEPGSARHVAAPQRAVG